MEICYLGASLLGTNCINCQKMLNPQTVSITFMRQKLKLDFGEPFVILSGPIQYMPMSSLLYLFPMLVSQYELTISSLRRQKIVIMINSRRLP